MTSQVVSGLIDIDFEQLMACGVGLVVLRHLASTQERVGISRLISRECRELVDAQISKLRLNLKDLCNRNDVPDLPVHFPRLKQLSFDRQDSGKHVNGLLDQLAQNHGSLLAKLDRLDLSNCEGLEAGTLDALLGACPALTSLCLPNLSGSVSSTCEDFASVLGGCTNLQSLQGAGDYSDPSCVAQLASLTHLQQLDLSPGKTRVVLLPEHLAPLSRLSALTSLQLGNHLATHATCQLAASLPSLHTLSFVYCDDYPPAPAALQPLTHSKSLRKLDLCSVVLDQPMASVLGHTPMTSLKLQGTFALTPKAACLLPSQLTTLSLQLADRDIPTFTSAIPKLNLSSLSLAIHRASEPCHDLLAAITGQQQLTQLTLESHYYGLVEPEFDACQIMPKLTHLTLVNHFTDTTLCSLVRCAPNLTHLSLVSCGSITDLGLCCAASHCRGLKQLELTLCRGVSRIGVAAAAAAPRVTRVTLEGCRNVTVEDTREVMRLMAKHDLEIIKTR